jgi:hypothetical protein
MSRPGKPSGLVRRAETKAKKQARVDVEESLAPERDLPMSAPARLKGHDQAGEVWRRLMRGWAEIQARVVTRLDMDLLVDYCILMEQVAELDLMRKTTYRQWLEMGSAHDTAIAEALIAKRAADEAVKMVKETGGDLPEKGPGSLAEVEKWEEKAIQLAGKCLDAFEAVVKLDSRVDRKRSLLLQWRQSLYLTPRARAGAAPEKKEKEETPDPLEQLLGNVTDFVNGDGK